MPTIHHCRTQHPVGHGCFHDGVVSDGANSIRYVYDCGAVRRSRCDRLAQVYADSLPTNEIDALIVSHLHSDHVSGLDVLLASLTPRYVFLPYLRPVEHLLHVAAALDGASPVALAMSVDPAAWFIDRGAGEVVLVVRGNREGEAGPPRQLDEPPPEHVDDRPPLKFQRSPRPRGAPVGVSYMRDDTEAHAFLGGARWRLRFFVSDEATNLQVFEQAALREFELDARHRNLLRDQAWLRNGLKNRSWRAKLARAYRSLGRGLNYASLCAYSGPTGRCRNVNARSNAGPWTSAPGWLAAGDAELADEDRCNAFCQHFADVAEHVGTLMLPHHGSIANFNPMLIEHFRPSVTVVTAPARTTKKARRHPHRSVVLAARDFSEAFRIVTDRETSELWERVEVEF